jgi:hypothetical protein
MTVAHSFPIENVARRRTVRCLIKKSHFFEMESDYLHPLPIVKGPQALVNLKCVHDYAMRND